MYTSDEVFKFLIKRIKHPKSDRSFLNDRYTDLTAWRDENVKWVLSQLYYSPNIVDFAPVETECVDFGAYVRKRIYFYTAEDCKVSSFLLVPKNVEKPAPAVVCLHCHSNRFYRGKEKMVDLTPEEQTNMPDMARFQAWGYGGRGVASMLAQRGYVVLVIDSLGWGERGWMTETWLGGGPDNFTGMNPHSEEYARDYDHKWKDHIPMLEDACVHAGTTYMGIRIWDDLRSLDFLASLPEVDADRIGCIGLGMGGFRAAVLGALDTGIKCSVPVGFMPRMSDLIPRRWLGQEYMITGLYDSLPYADLASMTAPRPMLVLNCDNDKLIDISSANKAAKHIAQVYAKAGAEDKFEMKNFPVGHNFDSEMQDYAFEWMDNRLMSQTAKG